MFSRQISFVLSVFSILLISGCDGNQTGVLHQCGSPCPHITPHSVAPSSLLDSYRASALGRDLSPENQIAASRALQELLRTGDYRREIRWGLPDLPEFDGSPKGRFSLISGRQERKTACLTYFQEIIFPHKTLQGHGKACREHSGLWRIVEEHPYGIR